MYITIYKILIIYDCFIRSNIKFGAPIAKKRELKSQNAKN